MSQESEDRVLECLEMANEASRKAEGASSHGEAHFWLRMEKRWLRLAQTYRATEALTAAWLAAAPSSRQHS